MEGFSAMYFMKRALSPPIKDNFINIYPHFSENMA